MTTLEEKTVKALSRIPRGRVTTYQALAKFVGRPKAVRAIANAVGKNPFAPQVPCHRVVRSDGTLGGYSAPGGLKTKIKLLHGEGVKVNGKRIDVKKYGYWF